MTALIEKKEKKSIYKMPTAIAVDNLMRKKKTKQDSGE